MLEQLSNIQMLDVCLPVSAGCWLIMPSYTEPQPQHLMLLEQLKLTLPSQPPLRIRSGRLLMPDPPWACSCGGDLTRYYAVFIEITKVGSRKCESQAKEVNPRQRVAAFGSHFNARPSGRDITEGCR